MLLPIYGKNTDILWAGTEIGIVESTDNGNTWSLIEGFPHVPVWDMKERDNVVVIATHGRGIWTAAFDRFQQSLTFAQPSDVNQSAGSFQLVATATSGLPVTFSSPDTDKIRIDGNQVTILKPGKITVTASQDRKSTRLKSSHT